MQTQSTLTKKQIEILKLLYTYRYLNRPQIQTLLKHKDKRRIISWLKDLRDNKYIDWKYDATDFIGKTKPAIYYLSVDGVRYLRANSTYPSTELKKRYKDRQCSDAFIGHCLLIVDCSLALMAKSNKIHQYTWLLPSDYVTANGPQNYSEDLHELQPHLFFAKEEDGSVTNYVVENFVSTLPRYQLRKRLNQYIDSLASDWRGVETTPIALFICPTKADLIYIKRRIKYLFRDMSELPVIIMVATINSVRANSITEHIWEEIV